MATPEISSAPAEELTFCAVHPDRETGLRCNKCGRYMCVDCAVRTPVGYRCRECVRGIEDKFFNAGANDYLILAVVCAVLAGIGGAIVKSIGIPLLFLLIIGLPVGGAIGEAALRVIQRRRGRQSANVAVAATVIGGFVGAFVATYLSYSNLYNQYAAQIPAARDSLPPLSLDTVFTMTINDFGTLIFIGIIAFAVYRRFKMRM